MWPTGSSSRVQSLSCSRFGQIEDVRLNSSSMVMDEGLGQVAKHSFISGDQQEIVAAGSQRARIFGSDSTRRAGDDGKGPILIRLHDSRQDMVHT
jgi:hypothetical protein